MIRLDNIVFDYTNNEIQKRVLDQISFDIREGEYISLMGRNGSGKSTLARCLNGLLLPTEGFINVDGNLTSDAESLINIRRKVGMVFQDPDNQIVSTTVEREIAFGLENIGVSFSTMQNVVPAVLEKFNLTKYKKYPPHLLSGGEKQRLALAAVMAMNPEYLILDESTSMLDPASRQELLNILAEIKNDNKNKKIAEQITIILITQFPEETIDTDRLLIIDNGKIIFDDLPDIVFQNVEQIQNIGLDVPIEFEIREFLLKKGLSIEPLRDFK